MEETTALPLTVEPREIVYADRNQSIQRVVARFDGFTKEYFVSDHGHRAALLAVRHGEVLLARQYRLLIDGLSYEIPGGKVEAGEHPEAAAIRECVEETGVRCSALKRLVEFQASLDIWKNYTYVYYSEVCGPPSVVPGARVAWIPLEECLNMVFDGRIQDCLSMTALFAYDRLRERAR
jgi:ADP-ribose pyrophosphatase